MMFTNALKTFALTTTACAALAAPIDAHASSTLLVKVGSTLLSKVLGYGVDVALDEVLSDTTTVDLSEAAFAEIEDIVEDVVATYQFSDYSTNVEDAVDLAAAYTRRDGSDELLIASFGTAWDVYFAATSALNDMESVGLQGTSSFMLMMSLQTTMLLEMGEVDDLLGEDGDHYRDLAVNLGFEHFGHLADMEAEWETAQESLYPTSSVLDHQWYDGWYDNKRYKVCFTDGDGEQQCSSSTWTCKAPWYDTSAFAYSCESSTTASAEAAALRDDQIAEDTDGIFGADYDSFEGTLYATLGGTGWLDRDDVSGSGDWEDLQTHHSEGNIDCRATAILCRRISDGVASSLTGETVNCNLHRGFSCVNDEQDDGECDDYEVQFFCY